jgi:arsenate reductase-like glutaredoxin family protein
MNTEHVVIEFNLPTKGGPIAVGMVVVGKTEGQDNEDHFLQVDPERLCRNARSFLREEMGAGAATALVERDYARQPLTPAEIETIFGEDEVLPLLTIPATPLLRSRGFADQPPPRDELITMIIAEPNLPGRPIVRARGASRSSALTAKQSDHLTSAHQHHTFYSLSPRTFHPVRTIEGLR